MERGKTHPAEPLLGRGRLRWHRGKLGPADKPWQEGPGRLVMERGSSLRSGDALQRGPPACASPLPGLSEDCWVPKGGAQTHSWSFPLPSCGWGSKATSTPWTPGVTDLERITFCPLPAPHRVPTVLRHAGAGATSVPGESATGQSPRSAPRFGFRTRPFRRGFWSWTWDARPPV